MEFSYPPLMPDEGHDSNLLPEEWKYLPFVALPDGAHNFQEGEATARHREEGRYRSNPGDNDTWRSVLQTLCFSTSHH